MHLPFFCWQKKPMESAPKTLSSTSRHSSFQINKTVFHQFDISYPKAPSHILPGFWGPFGLPHHPIPSAEMTMKANQLVGTDSLSYPSISCSLLKVFGCNGFHDLATVRVNHMTGEIFPNWQVVVEICRLASTPYPNLIEMSPSIMHWCFGDVWFSILAIWVEIQK